MENNIDLLELLMFIVNDKANQATSLMYQQKSNSLRSHFYHGEYMAFCEVYTMLENMYDAEKLKQS